MSKTVLSQSHQPVQGSAIKVAYLLINQLNPKAIQIKAPKLLISLI
jgi:hypothetical protein